MSDKYEEGVWYGWNGGECPVHPLSDVQAVYIYRGDGPVDTDIRPAGGYNWGEAPNPIIAFRVVKEHREPREFWVVDYCAFGSRTEAEGYFSVIREGGPIIHVREVIKE